MGGKGEVGCEKFSSQSELYSSQGWELWRVKQQEGRGSRVSKDAGESGARGDAAINVSTLSPLPWPGEMGRRAGRPSTGRGDVWKVMGGGLDSKEGVLFLEPLMCVPIP